MHIRTRACTHTRVHSSALLPSLVLTSFCNSSLTLRSRPWNPRLAQARLSKCLWRSETISALNSYKAAREFPHFLPSAHSLSLTVAHGADQAGWPQGSVCRSCEAGWSLLNHRGRKRREVARHRKHRCADSPGRAHGSSPNRHGRGHGRPETQQRAGALHGGTSH